MALDRSDDRNVHMCDASHPNVELEGLILTSGIFRGNFISTVEILLLFESDFCLKDRGGIAVEWDDTPLCRGKY